MSTPSIPSTWTLLAAAAATAAGGVAPASAQWAPPYWTAERIGLFTAPEFTRTDGYQFTRLSARNSAGRVAGISDRFSGASPAGRAAWTWAPGSGTVRLGFYEDPRFTAPDGSQDSSVERLNAAGRVTGVSRMSPGSPSLAQASWTWHPTGGLVATGLSGPEYSDASGRRLDFNDHLSEDHRITGRSVRYNGGASPLGEATWTWSPAGGTVRTGLFGGPEFTHSNGTQVSNNDLLNDAGRIAGRSNRYAGSQGVGVATWTWDAAAGTTRTGLFDGPEFTRSDGYQFSLSRQMNAAGRITGSSTRANGASSAGEAAWTWSPAGGTVRIGLFDGPEFTGGDGSQTSTPVIPNTGRPALTESGWIIGSSTRYNGAGPTSGLAAWAWHETTGTVRTGLTAGPEFTSSSGTQHSVNLSLNEAGRVMGVSSRYIGAAPINRAAWTWDAASGPTRIGLIDGPEFAAADGSQNSLPTALNEAGRITGWSERYSGSTPAGRATWTWDAAAGTLRTGLHAGPDFTRADGYQFSDTVSLLGSGRITGTSERFAGGDAAGTAAWTWTPDGGTLRIGLYDATHTSNAGVITNAIASSHESGFIIGTAQRSGGGAAGSLGQSGWFFDPATDLTTPLVFSTAPDSSAFTVPTLVTENGWVLGLYGLYDDEALLSTNTFLWSLDRGFTDLGGLIDGGLPADGIAALTSILGVDEAGRILAAGLPMGAAADSQALYGFVIPAPSTAVPLAALTLLATRRTRARRR